MLARRVGVALVPYYQLFGPAGVQNSCLFEDQVGCTIEAVAVACADASRRLVTVLAKEPLDRPP
jgi:hypothetical protein